MNDTSPEMWPELVIPVSRAEDFLDLMAAGWPEFGQCELPGIEFFASSGCPAPAASVQTSSAFVTENLMKRKAKKELKTKVVAEAESKDKRVKLSKEEDEESKITGRNSAKITKEANASKKNSELQKSDYVHVRARRGQATDSHSLAERARRERIGKKMKYLQNLVPGCDKIAGKAGMLDEIINYVRSLQQQVEILSMKLATMNPILDFSDDNLLTKQVFPLRHALELDSLTMESACFSQQFQVSSTWDADFHSLCPLIYEPADSSSGFLSNIQIPMKEEMDM